MSFNVQKLRSVWGEFAHSTEVGRHEIAVFERLSSVITVGANVLEIGIGDGRATRILKRVRPNANYFGVDITDALRAADAQSVYGDTRQLPFADGSFDAVFSLGVVEHFPETRLALAEHARVTRPGGYVVVTTPRLSLITAQRWFDYLRRGEFRRGSFEVVLGRNLRAKELRRHLQDAELRDVSVVGCGSTAAPGQLARAAKAVLPPVLWHPFLLGVGRKPEGRLH